MAAPSPKVSVIIPAYNYAHYLPDSIGSVLGQSLDDLELLVMDNCSADRTGELVARYAAGDARIRYVRNETNIGMLPNFNKGLSLASGEYIKILCADDVLEPACVERSVELLRDNPGVSLVSCARQLVDAGLQPMRSVLGYSDRFELVPGKEAIVRCLFEGNLIGEPSAVMFRRSDIGEGFRTEYRQLPDLDFWFRILERGDYAFLPERLCRIREHAGQATRRYLKMFVAAGDEIRIYRDYAHRDYVRLSFLRRQQLKLCRLSFCVMPAVMNVLANLGLVRR